MDAGHDRVLELRRVWSSLGQEQIDRTVRELEQQIFAVRSSERSAPDFNRPTAIC